MTLRVILSRADGEGPVASCAAPGSTDPSPSARLRMTLVLGVILFVAYACATTAPPPAQQPEILHGVASWYGQEFAGRTTANGEIFDPLLLTAAHRTLPFGTVLDVRNSKTGRVVRVRVNDRGPFVGNRMIDLSYAAAQQIGLVEPGSGDVDLYVVQLGRGDREPPAPYVVTVPPSPKGMLTDREPPPVEIAPPPPPPPAPTVVEPPKPVVVDNIKVETIHATPPPPAPPTPAPTPVVQKGGFSVQVGAFAIEANAKDLLHRLTQLGEQAHIDSGKLYLVRIGPFATREQAIKTRERLEASGMSAIIVAN
jgi:peptidoglycan lytic transglycosylase